MHGDFKALPLCSQQIFLRNMAVLENQFIGGRTADSHLIFLRSEAESRRSLFYNKGGKNLFLPALRVHLDIGIGDNNINIGFFSVGDKTFGAV